MANLFQDSLRVIALWLIAVSVCSAAPSQVQSALAIVDVTVIDAAHAQRLPARTVLIERGRITVVGGKNAIAIPAYAGRVDGHGLYLVPGLIDMHVHLFNNASHRPPNDWAFPLFVANGVTGVREMMTLPEQLALIAGWRADVERGALIAPRVLAAGIAVNGDSAEDVHAKVRSAKYAGADFIKVFSEVPAAQWRAIIDEARAQQLPVDGHVPATVILLEDARAGQRTAEHLMQVYEACASSGDDAVRARTALEGEAAVTLRDQQEGDVLAHFDAATCTRAARAVARTRQVHVPTLVLAHAEALQPRPDPAGDPRWRLLRADEKARWQRNLQALAAEDPALAALRWKISCRIARALTQAGVPLLAGTDTPMPLNYPGFSLHDELELLGDCGLTPAQALRAATTQPAQTLGLADVGAIAPGQRADLVLLDADPLRDIRNLRRIRAVVLAGRLLQREQLDALLEPPAR